MPYPTIEPPQSVAPLLAAIYLACVIVNVFAAWRCGREGARRSMILAYLAAAIAFVASCCSFAGSPPPLPGAVKALVDAVLGPGTIFLGAMTLLVVMDMGRRFVVLPAVALLLLNGMVLLFGLSLTDPVFATVAGRPDHVPIVAMIGLLAGFTWLATYQAVENDRRLAAGKGPLEATYSAKVLTWPDLVYIELIVTVALLAVLVAWSLLVPAPLESPANPAVTPNPAKAPWYFLGLQEWLVYADAWFVGFVVPCLLVLGLMLIPYLDTSTEGSGYYAIRQRRGAYQAFMLAFFLLWILPILVGTFMRGPNWSFFGPYEPRDPGRVSVQDNVSLSEYLWGRSLGHPQPRADGQSGVWR
ncbi:MAG: hypothetical protein U1E05_26585, partial [Patescibacteria group bacterium]|nr:hypothetical protein [Patescibacteria group bacterium]